MLCSIVIAGSLIDVRIEKMNDMQVPQQQQQQQTRQAASELSRKQQESQQQQM
jgi:hypothetical protein